MFATVLDPYLHRTVRLFDGAAFWTSRKKDLFLSDVGRRRYMENRFCHSLGLHRTQGLTAYENVKNVVDRMTSGSDVELVSAARNSHYQLEITMKFLCIVYTCFHP